ncbi:MAG TPA: ester cyclase [Bryobacteraceae bacterium]
MSDENKTIARKLLEDAWNGGQLEALDTLVSGNCRFHDPVFPSMAPGVDGLRRHIRMCRNAFPDLKYTIDDMIAERNEVVVHWTMRGTQRQSFLGMAPSNRTASISGTTINRIDDRKIVEQWSDWNLLSLLEQLGLATAPKEEVSARATRQ